MTGVLKHAEARITNTANVSAQVSVNATCSRDCQLWLHSLVG